MKLLIVAYYLPPLIYPQSIQVGRWLNYLPEDYKLYVVTADEKDCQKDERFYSNIYEKFKDYIKIPFSYNLFIRLIRRTWRTPDEIVFWHRKAYKKIIKKWGTEKFDRIITFSHPLSSNLLGLWLKKFFNIKWIAFFSDPWVDSPYSNYKYFIKNINSNLEKKVFINANNFVFPSPEMRDTYVKKYPFISKIAFYLEHTFDAKLYRELDEKAKDRLVLRHIGNIYGERNPLPILRAIKNLLDKKNINPENFVFEFVGSLEKKYESIKKDNFGGAVLFKEPVPYIDSLNLMQETDILVNLDGNIKNSVFLPSKLLDYIGAGKPILGITPKDSASARVINKIGGWVVEPNDIQGIENMLSKIVEYHKNAALERFKPLDEVKKEFDISNNINKFIKILEENGNQLS